MATVGTQDIINFCRFILIPVLFEYKMLINKKTERPPTSMIIRRELDRIRWSASRAHLARGDADDRTLNSSMKEYQVTTNL